MIELMCFRCGNFFREPYHKTTAKDVIGLCIQCTGKSIEENGFKIAAERNSKRNVKSNRDNSRNHNRSSKSVRLR